MDYEISNQEIETMTQWVTFMLEGEKYGIDVMHVKEVLRDFDIAPVPGAPSFVMGIINLRGNVVTVVDTRLRFGLTPREIDENTRVIVIETEDLSLGLLVDAIAEVADIPKNGIEITPNMSTDDNSKYIMGVYSSTKDLIILVDIAKLISDSDGSSDDLF